MTRIRQIEAYTERQRQADMMRRLEFMNEPPSRWPLVAVIVAAAVAAIARAM